MQTENRFFDDIARLAGGALSTLAGVKNEIEALVRQQFERLLSDMNMVSRDEFEAVQAMAAKARTEQEALQARIAALEARLAPAPAATGRGRRPRPAAEAAHTAEAPPRRGRRKATRPEDEPTPKG